jgi:hypothetical protein
LQAGGHRFKPGILHEKERYIPVNDRQREFIASIIKIGFTVILGGMAGGRLFNLDLSALNYAIGTIILVALFGLGLVISGERQ